MDISYLEDIINKYPTVTDIHTSGDITAIQTNTGGLQILGTGKIPKGFAKQIFLAKGIDSSFDIAGRRCRLHVSRLGQDDMYDIDVRVQPQQMYTLEQCDVTDDIKALTKVQAGLIVVAGHTGSRKTTLLNAMIDEINSKRDGVIVTVEDPVEVVHSSKKCIVRQKEVSEKLSWLEALRDIYRENPDVVVISETRDFDAITAALDFALSGKLVLTTIHASSVEDTIRQFLSRAPADKLKTVANNLADVLIASIVHRVTLTRQFQREYMVFDTADRQYIRDYNRLPELPAALRDKARQNKPGYRVFPS